MKKQFIIAGLVGLVALAAGTQLQAQSAWMPYQGRLTVTPGFSFSTFDEFWVGRDIRNSALRSNDESLDQYTGFVALEYAITDRLAADATIGYTATSSAEMTFGVGSDDGLADTLIGLRYQLVEEQRTIPAVTFRVGGIIAGTYDRNKPFSAGDGANGAEFSLLMGKQFGDSGFGIYGDIGYRLRENPVPDDLFGSVGLFKQFIGVFQESDAVTLNFGYRHVQGLSGLDIGGPGFAPPLGPANGFPALKEINQLIEGSIGYGDSRGRQIQFTVAKSVAGRNTGDKLIFLITVSWPFDIVR